MNLTDLIATPNQSKRLKELEVDLYTCWSFKNEKANQPSPTSSIKGWKPTTADNHLPAPTLEEVLQYFRQAWSKNHIDYDIDVHITVPSCIVIYKYNYDTMEGDVLQDFDKPETITHNAVDALIWAVENGLIETK